MGFARRGRPSERLIISPTERATLEQWTRRRSTAQGLAQRARIVLACVGGRTDVEVGRELRLSRLTIGRWRRAFSSSGSMAFSMSHGLAHRVGLPTP